MTTFLNDQAFDSLARDAAQSAIVDPDTGAIDLPQELLTEIDELPLPQALALIGAVRADEQFRANCRRMGLNPDALPIRPSLNQAAPNYAHRRARRLRVGEWIERNPGWCLLAALILTAIAKWILYPEVR